MKEPDTKRGKAAIPRLVDRLAHKQVLKRLAALTGGRVSFSDGTEHRCFGDADAQDDLSASIRVQHPAFYREVALGGVLGAGESYMRGLWDCDDLTALVRILLRNRQVLEGMDGGIAVLKKPLQTMLHWINRNTRRGSKRNIAAHYDLGNDFYQLWLDESMMYSSAIYSCPTTSLESASVDKLDRICRKLKLTDTDRVVEIGTGWGGFALHAAGKYGCHVTTTTISQQQHAYAAAAIRAAGLEDRITLLQSDYRDLEGEFDKLVSIEMIEAVGWQYQDRFFHKCSELLKPHGQMLLQAITIADQHYERYKSSVDFIRRYIFPGGCLCSVTAMMESLTRSTDLRSVHLEDIGPHYARTLRDWRLRFQANIDAIRTQGYGDEFIRMWNYYLAYCEGAFMERAIGNVQLHLVKPEARADVIGFERWPEKNAVSIYNSTSGSVRAS